MRMEMGAFRRRPASEVGLALLYSRHDILQAVGAGRVQQVLRAFPKDMKDCRGASP
jgi:hypothetical protein